MARKAALADPPIYAQPWFLVLLGLALNLTGWIVGYAGFPAWFRLGDVFVGTLVAAIGLRLRLAAGRWAFLDRAETAGMIAVAGVGSMLAWYAMNTNWEAGRALFAALFILSLVGSVLVLLPPILQRVILSLLLLFHFGGMVTAVTSVDPPGASGPWLSKQLWTRVYQPYLSFLYLTNAYHFYSPDPGPPNLFWFAVQYEDETGSSYDWIKIPERSNSPIGMHYQRLLALPEHTFSQMNRMPFNRYELNLGKARLKEEYREPVRGSWEDINDRRVLGSTFSYPTTVKDEDGILVTKGLPIPTIYGVQEQGLYREPHDTSKMLIESVAKRIFWSAPPRSPEGRPIKSVKMYRVTHMILTPAELAKGVDPRDKTKHWAYFMGEFNAQGKIVDEKDPFLYWYIPIAHVPKNYDRQLVGNLGVPAINPNLAKSKDTFVLDCLEMHAAGPIRKKNEQQEKKP